MAKNEKTAEAPPDHMTDPALSDDDKIRLKEFNTDTGSWTGGVYHPELELARDANSSAALPDYLKAASLSSAGLSAAQEFRDTDGRWPAACVLESCPPAYFEDPRLRPGDLRDVEEYRAKTGMWIDPEWFDQMLATREAQDQPPPAPRRRFNWLTFAIGVVIGRDLARPPP